MDLVATIQSIIQESYEALKPTDIAVGKVVTTNPITIQTSVEFPPIPSKALILTKLVQAYDETVRISGSEYDTTIHHYGLSVGDSVVMIRAAKGQRYIVLSKI